MPKKVRIPTPLRKLTNNEELVEVNAATIGEAIIELQTRFPGIQERLLDEKGEVLTGGSEEPEAAHFGYSVALSGDGETALIGGPFEGKGVGAAGGFTHSGSARSGERR